jgi:pimeloyl-ACP methyl ester carboxylesterase
LVVTLLALALPATAHAELRFRKCETGMPCARLAVPLDRSGAQPGRISLYVERRRAIRRPRAGVTVLLAGGPGQPATGAFGGFLPGDSYLDFATLMLRHDIVAFDARGTGRSGLLRCPELEGGSLLDAGAAAARCAERLGARRGFHRTADTVEDVEALRVALGAERLTLVGVSYGTLVAQSYAARYPDRVERLVLDSVLDRWDPFYVDVFAAVPRVLRAVCRRGCARFTDDPVADLARLVRRLARAPMRGTVTLADGRRRRSSLTRQGLFYVWVSTDLDDLARAAFPGAVASALRGDPAPILRLQRRSLMRDRPASPRDFSTAAYAASSCEEIPFPWPRFSEPASRFGPVLDAVARIPAAAFHPFDAATAAGNDFIRMCRRWPEASPGPLGAPPAGSLPDVPVLMLNGEEDLRTPLEGARRAAAAWPDARLVTFPRAGHSVLGADLSGCARRVVRRFLAGGAARRGCRGVPAPPVLAPLPGSLADLREAGRRPARVVRAVQVTLRDVYVEVLSTLFAGGPPRGGGLRGGRWSFGVDGRLRLHRVEVVPGVRVSAALRDTRRGRVRVDGPGRLDGSVRVRRGTLSGLLGGHRVRARAPFAGAARIRQMRSSRAVSSLRTSPVLTVPVGSMSRTCASSSALGQCSTPRGTTKSSPAESSTSRSRN